MPSDNVGAPADISSPWGGAGFWNLNDAQPQGGAAGEARERADVEALARALAECAHQWVPDLFPLGKLVDGVIRCANISGAAPRKDGSCHIQTKGDHAGGWFDHSTGEGGGPLSTIKAKLRGNVIENANRILERCGSRFAPRKAQRSPAETEEIRKRDAAYEWAKVKPLAGTVGEKYLRDERGIARLPDCEDLGFSDDCVRRFPSGAAIGQDAILARFRIPEGVPSGGIHRIYLKSDGTRDGDRKMLGPADGAVVMLGKPDANGQLGIAEGIETTAAAMQMFGVPGWAAASAGGLRKFGQWLRADPANAKAGGIRVLYIWADVGADGESAGRELFDAAVQCGAIPAVGLFLPRGGDDFNSDLQKGLAPDAPVAKYANGKRVEQPRLPPPAAAEGEVLPPMAMAAISNPPPDDDPFNIKALAAVIARFNAQYAVVNEAGKALVYERQTDPQLRRMVLTRITFADLKKFYQNKTLVVLMGGKEKAKCEADWWINDIERRQYLGGVTFDPTGNAPENMWNLWTGYAAQPAPGDWSLLRAHIIDVVCGGDIEHAEYLFNWIAYVFQNPNKPGEVAIVLRGGKGCGKGIFFRWVARAWGQHGLQIANAKHLVGNFNSHLRDLVFLFADEAFFAGDKEHESVLKALITEPTLPIEGKHQNLITVANMLHVGMASNSDWVVPASHDERRFFMRDVLETRVGDFEYFAAIEAQMENGGLAAMIDEMLKRDISRFNVRNIPHTSALDDQKQHSLDSLDRWWSDCLSRGFVWRSKFGAEIFAEWHPFATTELLYASYLQWCAEQRINRVQARGVLGKRMTQMYPKERPAHDEIIGEVQQLTTAPVDRTEGWANRDAVMYAQNQPGYVMHSLDQARAAFAKARGGRGEW